MRKICSDYRRQLISPSCEMPRGALTGDQPANATACTTHHLSEWRCRILILKAVPHRSRLGLLRPSRHDQSHIRVAIESTASLPASAMCCRHKCTLLQRRPTFYCQKLIRRTTARLHNELIGDDSLHLHASGYRAARVCTLIATLSLPRSHCPGLIVPVSLSRSHSGFSLSIMGEGVAATCLAILHFIFP